MRILQINSVYGYGSTGRIVENLHHAIQKSGNQSFVIYGRGQKSKDKNVFRIGNKIEQAIDLVGTRLLNRHAQSNFINTELIIKKIKEIKPDIIHLHNLHGYYVNFIKLLSFLKKTSIKIVWLLHDTWLISGSSADEGGLNYDWEEASKLSELRKISKEYPKHFAISSRQSPNNYIMKKNILVDTNIVFVTPSKWLSDIIKKSFLKNNRIITIHNGIDISQFNILNIDNSKSNKNILGVANVWEERKGLKFFEKLANDLDNSYSITLVGVSKKQKETLNQKIKCIERTNSIQELVELYNKADVFVNPTLYDNFPTVNIEAQACGTPVITFNTGGSSESVIDGITGEVIEKGDYYKLLKAIEKNPKKTDKIMSKTRKNAKRYSVNKMVNNYIELYNKILD